MVAFSCALGEGAMADWASIYMSNEINSSNAQAAFAYTIFLFFYFYGFNTLMWASNY